MVIKEKNMNKKRNTFVVAVVMAVLFVSLVTWSAIDQKKYPKIARKTQYSDEIQIKSLIHKLEQSIKNNDAFLFERIIVDDYEDSTGSKVGKHVAKQKFLTDVELTDFFLRSPYSNRRSPALNKLTPSWDFEIEIDKMKIFKKNTAKVDVQYYFNFDQPDDVPEVKYVKKPKHYKDKIDLVCIDDEWKIQTIHRLFKNMKARKERLKGFYDRY